MLVFLALGLGLAAPSCCWRRIPALARARADDPDAGWRCFKQALAFPMLHGASAWLVWVLSQEAGIGRCASGAVAGLVLLGFAAWVAGIAQAFSGQGAAVRSCGRVHGGVARRDGGAERDCLAPAWLRWSWGVGGGCRAFRQPGSLRCAPRDGRCSST